MTDLRQALAQPDEEELLKQGWRKCAVGQRTTQYCGMAEQARLEEREACALICENMERNGAWITKTEAAQAIRARGIDAATVGEVGIWGEELPVKTYCGGKPNYCTPEDEPVGWGSFFFSDDCNPHDHVDTVTNSTNPVQNPHKHKENI